MDGRLLRSIQILALDAVENPNYDAFHRKVARWYSREFSTPLPQVEELDPVHLFQTYYEERFSLAYQPDDEKAMELYERLKSSICFPEEVKEIESEDANWEEEMLKEIAAQNEKAALKAQEVVAEKAPAPEPPNTMQEALDQGEEIVMSGEDDMPPTFED